MPYKLQPRCLLCGADTLFFEEEVTKTCQLCGEAFDASSTCDGGHYVCHTCRQSAAREAIIAHCLESGHQQPHPLMLELMQLPRVAMHGPEHHLLLTAALLTAYCNEKGSQADLPGYLAEANERSMAVPGGACGFWGVCGAAIGCGIYASILTEADPYTEKEWKTAGQLTARCASTVSGQGGPRCCKRDSFLSFMEAAAYSNEALGTHFAVPQDMGCGFYPNNEECKRLECPFFPAKRPVIPGT